MTTSSDISQDTPYPEITIRDLRANMSAWLKALEEGEHKYLVIKRYSAPLGVLMLHPQAQDKLNRRRDKIIAQAEAEKTRSSESHMTQLIDIINKTPDVTK